MKKWSKRMLCMLLLLTMAGTMLACTAVQAKGNGAPMDTLEEKHAEANAQSGEPTELLAEKVLLGDSSAEDKVIELLHSFDPDFDEADYQVVAHDHSGGFLTLNVIRVVDGVQTSSGYVASVADNQVQSIVDNRGDFTQADVDAIHQLSQKLQLAQDGEPQVVSNALALALAESQKSSDKQILGQRYEYFYENHAAVIQVFTDYTDDGNLGVDLYVYPLE